MNELVCWSLIVIDKIRYLKFLAKIYDEQFFTLDFYAHKDAHSSCHRPCRIYRSQITRAVVVEMRCVRGIWVKRS